MKHDMERLPDPDFSTEKDKQLERMKEAALLAMEGKFRCNACGRVMPMQDGVVMLLRGNVGLGVCANPQCLGPGFEINPNPTGIEVRRRGAPAVMQAVPQGLISDIRDATKSVQALRVGAK